MYAQTNGSRAHPKPADGLTATKITTSALMPAATRTMESPARRTHGRNTKRRCSLSAKSLTELPIACCTLVLYSDSNGPEILQPGTAFASLLADGIHACDEN